MVYPFLSTHTDLKRKLIEKKIFVPTYWPNVLETSDANSVEHRLAKNLIHLPIDQRYGKSEMRFIVETVRGIL